MSADLRQLMFWPEWYAARYGVHGLDPSQLWDHYRAVGHNEGLCPNPLFDPQAYLAASADVAAAGVDPLMHYLQNGWWELRSTGVPLPGLEALTADEREALEVFFWPEWYLAQLPPSLRSGLGAGGALLHFLRLGVMLRCDPNPLFSVQHYGLCNPGLLEAAGCPTLHYLRHGGREGRICHPLVQPDVLPSDTSGLQPPLALALQRFLAGEPVRFNTLVQLEPLPAHATRMARMQQLAGYAAEHRPKGNPLVEQAFGNDDLPELQWREQQQRPSPELEAAADPVQAIAFYLPQFHRIPENDAWWGEGFTDWRNAERARPFYRGQLQPHRPHADLGAYDLADPEVLRRQAALAHRYGITAFCFYHYWFDGRLLLETPLQHWLADRSIELPLCLCWANESWSRRWDGRPKELLIAQTYPEGYTEGLAASLLPALRDPRYLRWNGRPVLLVYRPSDLPDAAAFARDLRAALAAAGVPELELLGVWSFDRLDPHSIGFNGAVQFSPLQVPTPNLAEEPLLEVQCEPQEAPKIYAYAEAIRHGLAEAERPHPFPLYSGLCPSWDNTARRGCNSVSWIGATPGRFERWLRLSRWRTQDAHARGELRAPALFINAWNEWGEGCHLEPDQHWGYEWLESVQAGVQPLAALCPATADFEAALADCESPVLVDGLFWQSGHHGGGHYGLAVLWQLAAALQGQGRDAPRRRLWLALDPERPVDPRLRDLVVRHQLRVLAVRDVQAIADVVNQGLFATFFAPAIVAYTGYRYGECSGGHFLLNDGPTRVVGTLHDVRDWQLAGEAERITALRRSCGYGRESLGLDCESLAAMLRGLLQAPGWHQAITVSHASSMAMEPLQPAWRRVAVLAPPPDPPAPEPMPLPPQLAEALDGHPYLVLLHAQRPEKNAGVAVRAFEALRRWAPEGDGLLVWRLVLVGAASEAELGLPLSGEACVLSPSLTPGALATLLRNAGGLVYPGWFEGYGLPPVACLDLGVPALVAASGSLPEVMGDAAVVADPFDPASIEAGLLQLMRDPPAPELLAKRADTLRNQRTHEADALVELVLKIRT